MYGGHGQGKFRTICKFIMRGKNRIGINCYVIKIAHSDLKKDTYDITQSFNYTSLNDGL